MSERMTPQRVAHLDAWLTHYVPPEERDAVLERILIFVNEHRDVLGDHSWAEIRALAEKTS